MGRFSLRRGDIAVLSRKISGGLVGLLLLAGLAGCGSTASQGFKPPSQLVVAESSEPTTLVPGYGGTLADVNAESAIFNSLVSFTSTGGFAGSLAARWSVASNHKVWTFYLRPGVLWQDGKPFTSKDVVFTFNVDTNPKSAVTGVPPIITGQVQSVVAQGPDKVVVTLKHTLPANLFLQAVSYVRIIPEHILGSVPVSQLGNDTAFSQHPIGTGPLQLVKWVQGAYLKFKANPHYFMGAPHIQNVVMDIVPSPTTALAQLKSGAVSLVDSSNAITASEFKTASHYAGVKGYENSTLSWKNITLVEQGLFKDVKVRQALAYATPTDTIIHSLLDGYAVPAYYSQPQTSWQGTMKGVATYPFSLAKAKQLLASDGFTKGSNGILQKNGQPLSITLYTASTDPQNAQIARILQQDWRQVGVQLHIRMVDPNAEFAPGGPLFAKTGLNAFLFSWIQGPDPEADAYHWLGANSVLLNPAGGNYARYNNPTVNHLLTLGATTFSQSSRAPLYHQVDRILSQQVPDIFLWWSDSLTLANSHLTGYKPNAYSFATFWNFQNWRWK